MDTYRIIIAEPSGYHRERYVVRALTPRQAILQARQRYMLVYPDASRDVKGTVVDLFDNPIN